MLTSTDLPMITIVTVGDIDIDEAIDELDKQEYPYKQLVIGLTKSNKEFKKEIFQNNRLKAYKPWPNLPVIVTNRIFPCSVGLYRNEIHDLIKDKTSLYLMKESYFRLLPMFMEKHVKLMLDNIKHIGLTYSNYSLNGVLINQYSYDRFKITDGIHVTYGPYLLNKVILDKFSYSEKFKYLYDAGLASQLSKQYMLARIPTVLSELKEQKPTEATILEQDHKLFLEYVQQK